MSKLSQSSQVEAKADAEGSLGDTRTTRDVYKSYLDDLTATCSQKASEFEGRRQLRAEEIQAIEKATEILASIAMSVNADRHLPSLLQ